MKEHRTLHSPRVYIYIAILLLTIVAFVLAAACSPSANQDTQALLELGKSLTIQKGCVACHSTDGSRIVGPTFLGLYGSQVAFEDGSTGKADEAYLRQSIVDPTAKIVSDYDALMPQDFGSRLTEEEISALIQYIKSLGE